MTTWSAEVKDILIDRLHPEKGLDEYEAVRFVWLKLFWSRALRALGWL